MSKKVFFLLLVIFFLSLFVLLIIIFRINPYQLSEKELLFFLLWIFLLLFPFFSLISVFVHRSFLRRSFAQWVILRQGLFCSLYFTLLLALQIFGAFSILGAVLLGIVFLLLELYFK